MEQFCSCITKSDLFESKGIDLLELDKEFQKIKFGINSLLDKKCELNQMWT